MRRATCTRGEQTNLYSCSTRHRQRQKRRARAFEHVPCDTNHVLRVSPRGSGSPWFHAVKFWPLDTCRRPRGSNASSPVSGVLMPGARVARRSRIRRRQCAHARAYGAHLHADRCATHVQADHCRAEPTHHAHADAARFQAGLSARPCSLLESQVRAIANSLPSPMRNLCHALRPHFAILPTQLALLPPQACSRSVSRMSRRWRSLRRRAPTPAQARCSVDERELVRVSPLGALTQRQSHQCLCSFAQVQPRTSILHGRDRVSTSDAGACICSRHASPRAPPSHRLRPAQALPPTLVLLVQARRRHRPRRRAAALNATVKLNAATTLDANAALDVTAALDATTPPPLHSPPPLPSTAPTPSRRARSVSRRAARRVAHALLRCRIADREIVRVSRCV